MVCTIYGSVILGFTFLNLHMKPDLEEVASDVGDRTVVLLDKL